ncbi:hypothetical protein NHQ30_009565 [Ciborinia camelliae]|nr:hypothetical protein NHQ30_009565 [Ciborinia camelliae]
MQAMVVASRDQQFTALQISNALSGNDRCSFCIRSGYYFYLPTGSRCCHECLKRNEKLKSEPLDIGMSRWQLTVRDLSPIRIIKTTGRNADRHSVGIVNYEAAVDVAIVADSHEFPYKSSKVKDWDQTYEYSTTALVTTAMPFIHPSALKVELGHICYGCAQPYEFSKRRKDEICLMRDPPTVYSESEFMEYFEQCESAKGYWSTY